MMDYVITIARGYGSGGRTIGKMLAEELGIPFYDREIVRLASDDSGINEELFGQADEVVRTGFWSRIRKKAYDGGLIPPESREFVSDENLFNYQAKVIRDLAEHGPCVIVGRCADYILKDTDKVVRLFVYGSEEHCLNRLEDMFGESRKDLEKRLRTIDKHREAYYEHYTGCKWNDARNYDLCINTGEMSFEQAVSLVKAYISIMEK